jgi:uracil-DNA glycosylase family 4
VSGANKAAWQNLYHDIITCRACPRLVEWREQVAREKRQAYRDWEYWGKPVPGFGDPNARLLIVGLAPGAHGSNRTGRQFTGDSSGGTLYPVLYETGFANQPTFYNRNDGLELIDAFITAVGRCAPPKNRPTAAELNNCRPFFRREWDLLSQVRVIVALGQIAFEGCLRLMREMGFAAPRVKFGHGVHYRFDSPEIGGLKHLTASYHPSRQNTQTGRLTPQMLKDVFIVARSLLDEN